MVVTITVTGSHRIEKCRRGPEEINTYKIMAPKAPKSSQRLSSSGGLNRKLRFDADGVLEGSLEGATEGSEDGILDGSEDGWAEGSFDGIDDGVVDGCAEGSKEGSAEGFDEGSDDGFKDGSANNLYSAKLLALSNLYSASGWCC